MTKGLFLALASLGLFACSNEDLTNAPVEVNGPAALTLKINTPTLSRALDGFTTTTDDKKTISISGDLVVRYLGTTGNVLGSAKIAYSTSNEFTLFGVPEGTTGIAIVGNGENTATETNNYEDAFKSTSAAQTSNNAAGVTVYGTDLELTPNGTITGNTESKNTIYAKYEATVDLKPVTSRLEVGGITFGPSASSNLKKLVVDATFINGAYQNGAFVVAEGKENVTPSVSQYLTGADFSTANTNTLAGSAFDSYPLKDEFDSDNVLYDVTTAAEARETKTFPANGECIGYNFFVNNWGAAYGNNAAATQAAETGTTDAEKRANLPYFTLKMTAEYNDNVSGGPSSGNAQTVYAVITSYQTTSGASIKSFLPGKLYQIKNITLPEKVLTPDPEGNQTIAVVATVTVQDWILEGTSGTWSGQE